MSLLDYQHPDILWGNAEVEWFETDGGPDTVVVVRRSWQYYALRVHAHRESLSHIFNRRMWVWRCTNKRPNGEPCGYFPGHEDLPPVPGQCCYDCKGLRAERIPAAVGVYEEGSGFVFSGTADC